MAKPDNERETPTSAMVAARGIKTTADFAEFMGALMEDLVSFRVDPDTARAACIAGDKIIDIARLQMEYAKERDSTPVRLLPVRQTARALTLSEPPLGKGDPATD